MDRKTQLIKIIIHIQFAACGASLSPVYKFQKTYKKFKGFACFINLDIRLYD